MYYVRLFNALFSIITIPLLLAAILPGFGNSEESNIISNRTRRFLKRTHHDQPIDKHNHPHTTTIFESINIVNDRIKNPIRNGKRGLRSHSFHGNHHASSSASSSSTSSSNDKDPNEEPTINTSNLVDQLHASMPDYDDAVIDNMTQAYLDIIKGNLDNIQNEFNDDVNNSNVEDEKDDVDEGNDDEYYMSEEESNSSVDDYYGPEDLLEKMEEMKEEDIDNYYDDDELIED